MVLNQGYAPHIRASVTVSNMMLELFACVGVLLVPSLFVYGARPIALVFMGVIGSVLPEVLQCLIKKEPHTFTDFSAVYAGVLVSLMMPASVPVWLPLVAGMFGAVAAKLPFGRLGRSVFSPAAAGFVFVSLAWGKYFEYYPKNGDTLPFLGNWYLPEGVSTFEYQTPIQLLKSGELPYPNNARAFEEVFLFKMAGPIGAIGVFVILAALAFMIFRRISAWQATASFCTTVFILALIFRYDSVNMWMSSVYELFCGWMLFAAVFLVGDIVTAPRFASARVIYGIFCGVLAIFLRRIAVCEGGEITAVLMMNAVSPAIDRMAWSARQRGMSMTALMQNIKLDFEKRMKQFED